MRATTSESSAPMRKRRRRTSRNCPEPDGQLAVEGTRQNAHQVMIDATGECPWCGEGDD